MASVFADVATSGVAINPISINKLIRIVVFINLCKP